MRESRLSGSVEGVMSNHDPYSDSPSPLVGFSTTNVYSGIGADIVMESITLKPPARRLNERYGDLSTVVLAGSCWVGSHVELVLVFVGDPKSSLLVKITGGICFYDRQCHGF